MAVFLVVSVLMQHGKASQLSGTIAGGAETFFGKTKGRTIDAMLSKVTTVVSIIFVVVVLLVYVIAKEPVDTTTKDPVNTTPATTETTPATQATTKEATTETTQVTAPATSSQSTQDVTAE